MDNTERCPCGYPGSIAECAAADQAALIALLDGEPQPGPNCCTQCGGGPTDLLPWGQLEKLCWDCADVQIDLLALATQLPEWPVEPKVINPDTPVEWQMDHLRHRRDTRLAVAEAIKADAWDSYHSAVETIASKATVPG